jgi:PEGA domain-containing protein
MGLKLRTCAFVFAALSLFALASVAQNKVLGELQLEGSSRIEKTSGVWIDGQYLGYVDELKGSKKILLLPGTHTLSVRQNGYQEFSREVTLQPGQKQLVTVTMVKAHGYVMPAVTSEVKISVNPDRAAVFLDGQYVGHAGEFSGMGKSMIVAPGHRRISISLPGYNTFNTEIDLVPSQKFVLKTDLVKSNNPQMEEPK